jgi:hypothetical protein
MDLGRAFGFFFEDENWLNKVLIGGLLQIIPIVGQLALLGYLFEVARNVAQGNPRPLPDWSDLGTKLVKGVYGFVISLVYSLPIIALVLVWAVLIAVVGVAGGNSEAAGGVMALLILCFYALLFVVALVIQVVILAAFARYVQTDSLSTALQFGEVIGMVRSTPSTWVVLFLVYILTSLVGSLGSIACGVGLLFTYVYGMSVFGHALGQVIARMGGAGGLNQSGPEYTPPPTY